MSSVYALSKLAKEFYLYISQSMAISWAGTVSVFISCSEHIVVARQEGRSLP